VFCEKEKVLYQPREISLTQGSYLFSLPQALIPFYIPVPTQLLHIYDICSAKGSVDFAVIIKIMVIGSRFKGDKKWQH